jgi:hypothetical protein
MTRSRERRLGGVGGGDGEGWRWVKSAFYYRMTAYIRQRDASLQQRFVPDDVFNREDEGHYYSSLKEDVHLMVRSYGGKQTDIGDLLDDLELTYSRWPVLVCA